jgi:predicted transcriptional regulator
MEQEQLSRRERQIMDIVYAHGETTALQITSELPDPPCHAAVRTMIRILEARGHLKHYKRGIEFVYQPTAPRAEAADKALERVLNVFFGGSFEEAVAAHLAGHADEMSPEQLKRLSSLIRKAKEQGKKP